MSDELGAVRVEDDRLGLRFERQLAATPEEVWAALTEPRSIRRWLFAEAELEPRLGGAFSLTWPRGSCARGSVRVWDPPRVLELDWIDADMRSVVRFEIEAAEAGARLVLDHRSASLAGARRVGPGWHAHLEALGALVGGGEPDPDRWGARYEALRATYDRLLNEPKG